MMGKRIQMRQLTQIIALVVLGIFWGSSNEAGAAVEQRCDALGANCICSEPMNTNNWVNTGDGQHFNPADTTSSDKQCGDFDGVANAPLASGSGLQVTGVNSGVDVSALPAAHTVTWVARGDSNNGSQLGHRAAAGAPTARRSIRFYKYWSTDYVAQSNSNSGCNGNKLVQMGPSFPQGPLFATEGGDWTLQDINTGLGWNQSVDCCNGPGPGNTDSGPSLTGLRGKWWRVEIITHNANTTGPGTYFETYIKNVTDNGPELHILDTSQTLNGGVGNTWGTAQATGLHPTGTINSMTINLFRAPNAAPCTGFASYSHFLYAAWSTDAGQRIGAAVEIEGGGGNTTPPVPPTNLTVTKLMEEGQ
jgi:hypothetical protein